MRHLLVAVIALLLSVASHVARAQDSVPWGDGEIAGWAVAVDQTVGNGCFIATIFEGDTTARIGFNPPEGSFYFQVGDLDWRSIESGKEYDVELQMGRKSPWIASAVGVFMDDLPTLLIVSDEASFVQEFASQHNIRVRYEGSEIANLSLRGSSAAIGEMIACQEAMNGSQGTPAASTDPFANSPESGDDPFAR
jgi:hypothetical protein